jgi:hypothetical protein
MLIDYSLSTVSLKNETVEREFNPHALQKDLEVLLQEAQNQHKSNNQ